METPEGTDDTVPAPTTELAGQLDRRLVRFGSAVAEEDLTRPSGGVGEEIVQRNGRVGRRRIGEEGAHVHQSFGLIANRRDDRRIGVAERDDGDSGQEIEISLAVHVPEFGPRTAFEHDRRRSEHRDERTVLEPTCFECMGAHDGTSTVMSSTVMFSTMVPMPASVNNSSNNTCGIRPSRTWARRTP